MGSVSEVPQQANLWPHLAAQNGTWVQLYISMGASTISDELRSQLEGFPDVQVPPKTAVSWFVLQFSVHLLYRHLFDGWMVGNDNCVMTVSNIFS